MLLVVGASSLWLAERVRAASAADLVVLDVSHPPAAALEYVADAKQAEGYPASANQRCDNCRHYSAIDDSRGRCALFPGFSVTAARWCAGWVAVSHTPKPIRPAPIDPPNVGSS